MSGSSTDTDTEPLFLPENFSELEANELRGAGQWVSSFAGVLVNDDSPLPVIQRLASQEMEAVVTPDGTAMPSTSGGYNDPYMMSTPPVTTLAPLQAVTRQYVLPHAPPSAVRHQHHQQQPSLSPPPPQPSPPLQPSPPPPQQLQPSPHAAVGDRFVESSVSSTQPALEAWPGRHGFGVTVRTPPPAAHGRQQPYVYDAAHNKLYVDLGIAVTFAFRVSEGTDTSLLRVSALPVYPDCHHVNTPVRRCPTHRQPELECNAGAEGFIDHVIRAEHDDATYQEQGSTRERRSVVVPFERPPPGTQEYCVSYKFCCMNTCVGGINRRRLVVLFSLENIFTGEELGRQTVEVKVCKCPHRDARTDRARVSGVKRPLDRVAAAAAAAAAAVPGDGQPPPARRRRTAGSLVIEVEDLEEYDHLMAVLTSFRAVRARMRPPAPVPAPPAAETPEQESSDSPAERAVPRRDREAVRHLTMSSIKREMS